MRLSFRQSELDMSVSQEELSVAFRLLQTGHKRGDTPMREIQVFATR